MITGHLSNCPECRQIKCSCPKVIGGHKMTIEQIKFEFNHLRLRSILLDVAMVKKFGKEAVAEYKYYEDQLYRLYSQR